MLAHLISGFINSGQRRTPAMKHKTFMTVARLWDGAVWGSLSDFVVQIKAKCN